MNHSWNFKNFFWNLTLRLEGFTSLIPIPSFVYFIALLGTQQNIGSLETIFTAGAVCGTATVIWGIGVRYYRLKKIFFDLDNLEKETLSKEQKEELKLRILNYPYLEGRTILQRWIVGYLCGYIFYIIIMQDFALYTFFLENYALLFVLPISYLVYVYISENSFRKILSEPILQAIPIDSKKLIYFGYFRRILLALFSVGIIPTSILGFFLYAALNSDFRFSNPLIHIIAISLLGFVSMAIVSYLIANSLKKSLLENNTKLNLLGKGRFNISSSYTTSDDFGKQAKLIGDVTHYRNLYNLALCYLNIGEIPRARKIFKQILNLNVEFPVPFLRKLKSIQKRIF